MDLDPTQRGFQIDPYPVFARFRAEAPVFWSDRCKGWFVFGYDDVRHVCDDKDDFSATDPASAGPGGMFKLDDPAHGEVRKVVEEAWFGTAARIPAMVERSITAALDALGSRQEFDLVDEFARPVPRDVFFDILGGDGIDAHERLQLDALARLVMIHHDHMLSEADSWPGTNAGRQLGERMAALLRRASDPRFGGSFLAGMAQAIHSGAIDPSQAIATLVNTTVAGYMSVEFLLATGIRRLLLDDAHWWTSIQADAALLPPTLVEIRRYEHALSVIDRFTRRNVEIGGCRIPAGSAVFGVLASANRDPSVFCHGDEFDPLRELPPKPQVAFGHGLHECMGIALESAIMRPAVEALMARAPDLRLRFDAQPPWFANFYFRSFHHLAVKRS